MRMTRPEYLSVKNFERFQHYRDRFPVWIKLYNALMDDEAFLALADAERGQLVLIWLLASRRDNKIPNDARAIARAIQSSGRVRVERFIAAGFLVPYQSASAVLAEPEQLASNPLAEAEQGASPHARPLARGEAEGEAERETEAEKKEPSPPPAAARKGRAGVPTWITPYAEVWKAKFGGNMPIGPACDAIAPLRAEWGEQETLRRWKNYIAVATAEYVNPSRFASTWDRWNHATDPAARNGKPTTAEQMSASMSRLFSGASAGSDSGGTP
jgi:hypothetical protein